jgi:hypothetical protein
VDRKSRLSQPKTCQARKTPKFDKSRHPTIVNLPVHPMHRTRIKPDPQWDLTVENDAPNPPLVATPRRGKPG